MTNNLSPSEQLAFTTIRIQCETSTGLVSTGSGFIFKFDFGDNRIIPTIVTNHHVVENAIIGTFQLTRSDENGNPVVGEFTNILIDNFEQRWIQHPQDLDLCAMPIAPLLELAQNQNKRFFYKSFHENIVASSQVLSELTALEEILIIGYPLGIWDSSNNMPIFRQGITATHPNINYEGREEFLIDAACFPGSSGSPVLLYNKGSYSDKQGNTIIGSRIYLLGILYAGPQYTLEGEIEVRPIPIQMMPVPVSRIPINLGYVIKAAKLLDFKRVFSDLINDS